MMMSVPSPPVPDEDFKLFHSIDRRLYTKLVIDLGRDPIESMHVMGFWLWLEQDLFKDLTIVNGMLSLPISSVNDIAQETVFCLRLIEKDMIQPEDYGRELSLLQNLMHRKLSVQNLHENRVQVRRGVSRIENEVCFRAFSDILLTVTDLRNGGTTTTVAAAAHQVTARFANTGGPSSSK